MPLVQALATATAAAQSAAAALEEVRRAQTASSATKPKELELTGRPEEDRRLWADWRFAATQFLASKDGACLTEIPQAIAAADPIDLRTMVQDRQQRARLLFREPTLASTANGFEAIRLFHKDVEPRSGAAFFPSNASMAFARSLHTFNRSKKMNCKLSCKAVYPSIASKALVKDQYTVQ